MKPLHLLRLSISLLSAAAVASAQGVVSQVGGFLEQVQQLPSQEAASPLSLFLQNDQPSFPVASPLNFPSPPLGPSMPIATPAPTAAWQKVDVSKKFATPKGLLSLRSMRVSNSGPGGSQISFGMGSEFSMGTDAAGNFQVRQSTAPAPLLSLDSKDTLHLSSSRVEAQALNALSSISVRGVQQWQLVYSDDFSAPGAGWSRAEVSQCGGVFMLGGFCKFSIGEVNKTFSGLPPHKQLRVVATYHFIDRWIGESGYMKLNIGTNDCDVPVWSEQHKEMGTNGVNLCGSATSEGKFSAPVDVTIPHTKDSVQVTFGSTIGDADPCDESWGVSAVEIYVRN